MAINKHFIVPFSLSHNIFYNFDFSLPVRECCGVVSSGLVCLLLNQVIARTTDSSAGMEKYDLKMFINFYFSLESNTHENDTHTNTRNVETSKPAGQHC